MLSDEVIEKVIERLVNRIEQGNTYLLEEIGKSIKRVGTLTPSKAQELVQIMRYGGDYDKIVKKLVEITKLNVKDIYNIFEEVAKENYLFAEQFYKYKNKKYIPWDENIQLQNQVRAIAKITVDNYVNLSNTIAFITHDNKGRVVYNALAETYQNILDTAIINAGQGKETFDSAMRNAIKELVDSGIRTVDYESGKSIRLESAVRMAMQGGIRDLNNKLQQQFGEEFGADGVEITVHENPAPDHELVQGRQFSKEEFAKFQNDEDAVSYDGMSFPATSEETGRDRRSISQYNCYHSIFSIVLGVNKPLHSNEELQAIIDRNEKGFDFDGKHYTMYEGQQLQRKIETEIRKYKDLQISAKATNDDVLLNESQSKINALTKKYKELNEASGLTPKPERMRVSGYRPIKVNVQTDDISARLKTYNITVDKSLFDKGMDKQLVNRSLNQVENLVNKYPILKETIKKNGLEIVTDYTAYAGSASPLGNRIMLSKGLYENKKKFMSLIKEGQDDNWSAKVHKENYDIYTITHETGHILEDAIMNARIKKTQNIDLYKEGQELEWYALKYQHQEDTDIFNELVVPVAKELGVNWEEVHTKYISDYGKSELFFEWFAELFAKMELGEQDIMTEALRKYLEGELWKK